MRTETRRNPPRDLGGYSVVPAMPGFRCDACGNPATRRVITVYRQSTVCAEAECFNRQSAWVRNLTVTQQVKRSKAPERFVNSQAEQPRATRSKIPVKRRVLVG